MIDTAYVVAGIIGGFAIGLTGVGGGTLMTPLLILGFGVSPVLAVGTDLLFAAATKVGGAWAYFRHRAVDLRTAATLWLGSIPAALVTLLVLNRLAPDTALLNQVITQVLGIALALTAATLLWPGKLAPTSTRTAHGVVWKTVLSGVFLGAAVTLTSVGAGVLGTAALLVLYPRFGARQIVGTDILHAVPLTVVAGLGHAHLGHVDWPMLGSLLLGSLPAVFIGARLAHRLSEQLLRRIIGTILLLIGARLVI